MLIGSSVIRWKIKYWTCTRRRQKIAENRSGTNAIEISINTHPPSGKSRQHKNRRVLSACRLILAALANLFVFQAGGGNALASSMREHPSFNLKIFGYEATIFYRPSIVESNLSTTIAIDQRYEPKVSPRLAEDIQRRINEAREVYLSCDPASKGPTGVDVFSKIHSAKPYAVHIEIHLREGPLTGEIGNLQLLSTIDKLSGDPDRSHFDEFGYRILSQPVVNLIMQRRLYSRPDGRPLFFFRRVISSKKGIYSLTGSFLVGTNARVRYTFRADTVPKQHWIDIDKAAIQFVAAILKLQGKNIQ